jgi:hypothetical protein
VQNFRQAQKQKKENTKKSNDGNVDINQKDSTAPMESQQTQHGADDSHSKNVEQELDKTKGSQDEENGRSEGAVIRGRYLPDTPIINTKNVLITPPL